MKPNKISAETQTEHSAVPWGRHKEQGVALIEAAILGALIAVVALAGVRSLGLSAADKFCDVGGKMSDIGKNVLVDVPWMFNRNWKNAGRAGPPCIKPSTRGA